MGMNDTISDMLTRMRNAIVVKKENVDVLNSKTNFEILAILKDKGYIRNFKLVKDSKSGILRVYLKYTKEGVAAIKVLERVSKLGLRIYVKNRGIKPVRCGLGTAIISTSKGIMSDDEAVKLCVGGEVLCRVW